jgi:PAS domain S-box-containing protein
MNDNRDAGATPGWLRGPRSVAAEMIVRTDWSDHAIGDPHEWPPSLRVLTSTMLGSPDPMHLVWGPDRVFLFNDAYAAILSERATTAMGARFEEVWPDAWPSLKHYIERAMGGEPVRFVDIAIPSSRHGMTADGWWSFSYAPARDEDGVVRGIVCTAADTTDDVQRRDALALVEYRAKADLERSEAGLRRAQRAGGIGVFWVDGENRIHGTEEFCRIFGLQHFDGIPAGEVERLVLPEDRALASDAARRADATAARDVEYRIRRANDGEMRWIARRAEFEPDDVAGGQRLVGVVQDITERRAANAALVESEAKFRAFTEAVPNQVWTALPDGALDWANARVYEYSGAGQRYGDDAEALPGNAWRQRVHPDDRAGVVAAWASAIASGALYEVEFRLRRHDGVFRWHIGRAVPLRDERGAIVRWVGTNTDIEEQRAAHDALADQAIALELRVEEEVRERNRVWTATSDLMGTAGLDGVLRRINPAWHRQLGWNDAKLLGGRFMEFIEAEDHAATSDIIAQLADGLSVTGFTNHVRTSDGRSRTITWSAVPEGDVFHVVGRDTTEQMDAEERLRQSQKMEAVGQLTGGLAHDFNNLLAGISGSLELIGMRLDQGRVADVAKYVTAAQGATRRAAALTHRLLAFARRQTLDPRPTNVNGLVAGMHELVQRTVGPSIHVEVVGASGLWTVLVDPPQLENALLNLCINARDAMPEGGRITIETANRWIDRTAARKHEMPEGQYLSLCVTDTGTGMPPEVVAKAFDPFFTTKPIGEGTGLGLSMIYGFAKQSGGQVRIYSEVGEGTTVCVYLPRHAGTAADIEPMMTTTELPRAEQGETVLVVDDEPTIRMLVAEILEDLGYVAIEAGDSVAGLRILESDVRIDLLVTDVGLPGGMNGRQMVEAAREHRRDLKVLFITGYAENALLGNGQLEPGMAVLTKPFAIDALGARIREMIRRP